MKKSATNQRPKLTLFIIERLYDGAKLTRFCAVDLPVVGSP
jgi:hypothetical protein